MSEITISLPDPDAKHYEVVVDGVVKPLRRVSRVLEVVHGGPKSGMAYWGADLATQYYCAVLDEDCDEWYEEFKSSPLSPYAVLKEAQVRGKAAHQLFEDLIRGTAWPLWIGDQVWVATGPKDRFVPVSYDLAALRAYLDLILPTKLVTEVLSEQRVYSLDYEYAGTADLIIPEYGVVGDLKTHKPPWRESDFIQMSAYTGAWKEMTGQELDRQLVIIAREDGEYEDWSGYMDPMAFTSLLPTFDMIEGFRAERASKSVSESEAA